MFYVDGDRVDDLVDVLVGVVAGLVDDLDDDDGDDDAGVTRAGPDRQLLKPSS